MNLKFRSVGSAEVHLLQLSGIFGDNKHLQFPSDLPVSCQTLDEQITRYFHDIGDPPEETLGQLKGNHE